MCYSITRHRTRSWYSRHYSAAHENHTAQQQCWLLYLWQHACITQQQRPPAAVRLICVYSERWTSFIISTYSRGDHSSGHSRASGSCVSCQLRQLHRLLQHQQLHQLHQLQLRGRPVSYWESRGYSCGGCPASRLQPYRAISQPQVTPRTRSERRRISTRSINERAVRALLLCV